MDKCWLFLGLINIVTCVIDEFHYIDMRKTWKEAQQYCREHFTDLATVESEADLSRIVVPVGVSAYIGLFDDPASWKGVMGSDSNSWRWSATGSTSPGGYQNWAVNEPSKSGGAESCVSVYNGQWNDKACTEQHNLVCYTVQSNVKTFVFVSLSMTWAESLNHCRQNYHDLAMIESLAENQAVTAVFPSPTSSAWIGLWREPWRWSDGSPSTFRNQNNRELDNGSADEDCMLQEEDKTWFDTSCLTTTMFVCHRVYKRRSFSSVKIKLQTQADLTAPEVKEQLLKLFRERLETTKTRAEFVLRWITPPTKQDQTKKRVDCISQ